MKKIGTFMMVVLLMIGATACSTTNKETQSTSTDSTERQPGGGLGNNSIDTSTIEKKLTDIAYGTQSSTQKLDIYYPNDTSTEPYPAIIAIHGGAFMMGNKTGGDVAPMLEAVNYGYVVISIDYRLSKEAVFPAAINDVKAAIRFVKAHADEYQINPDKIAVWGDSAGGNLAALAGTSGDDVSLNGDSQDNLSFSSSVAAVVDWFGPINFLLMDEQFASSGITPKMGKTSSDTSPESQYIGGNITQNVAIVEQANPETYISKNDPYFFIQHGSADQNVPTQQSIDFASKLEAVLGSDKVTFEILEGATHGGSQFEASENIEKVIEFLDSVLKD